MQWASPELCRLEPPRAQCRPSRRAYSDVAPRAPPPRVASLNRPRHVNRNVAHSRVASSRHVNINRPRVTPSVDVQCDYAPRRHVECPRDVGVVAGRQRPLTNLHCASHANKYPLSEGIVDSVRQTDDSTHRHRTRVASDSCCCSFTIITAGRVTFFTKTFCFHSFI